MKEQLFCFGVPSALCSPCLIVGLSSTVTAYGIQADFSMFLHSSRSSSLLSSWRTTEPASLTILTPPRRVNVRMATETQFPSFTGDYSVSLYHLLDTFLPPFSAFGPFIMGRPTLLVSYLRSWPSFCSSGPVYFHSQVVWLTVDLQCLRWQSVLLPFCSQDCLANWGWLNS